MKAFFISSQILYVLCLAPWFLIWGISFMGFDSGFSWFAVALTGGIGLYPIAVIVCSILAWRNRIKRKRAAVIFNLVPMLWIALVVVPVVAINL
ncbi:hypothetical protein FE782_12485 [Paenibacillus antri]|uniref:Uncharacterized protein n=1 Tax=Paenibacillus antri TaxID=2582848 RepID=A0A5R9GCW4_9BACL|nr:hypothetical protein [Paenibacillus antri]TLS52166.1 hypothetical protein FE782_12485 [Paenibacillus antri]